MSVSVPVQLERIAEGDYRPLLPVDNFAAIIDKLHDERDGLYEQVASFSLSSDDGDIEGHAASLVKAMTK
jgi:shikimate kinase